MSTPATNSRPDWLQGKRLLFYMPILRDGAGMVNRELGLAAELAQRGAQVTILSHFRPTHHPADAPYAIEKLLPTRYYDVLYKNPIAYPFIALLLALKLSALKPDVVFVDLHQEAIWAQFFRRYFGYKVVFTYHGVANSAFYPGAAGRELDRVRAVSHRMLTQADRVIVVSDFLLAESKRAGVDAVRLHNGVERDRYSPDRRVRNITCSGPIVLFVGRYTEYKGALNVVKAFVEAKKKVPDAELVMHGFKESPAYLQQIKDTIAAAGIADSVYLFGPLDGAEMPYHINRSRIFVNGSIDETFCMPLLEAQACGCPTVAFAAGGIPEVVADGVTGLLAPELDIDCFAAHMVRLLTDDAFHASCVAATDAHVARFTYPVLADALLPIIEPLLKEKA